MGMKKVFSRSIKSISKILMLPIKALGFLGKGIIYILKKLYVVFKYIGKGIYLAFKYIYLFIIQIFKYLFSGIKTILIGILKLIKLLIKYIIELLKYFYIGLTLSIKFIINNIYISVKFIFKNLYNGLKVTAIGIYKMFKKIYLFLKNTVLKALYKLISYLGYGVYKSADFIFKYIIKKVYYPFYWFGYGIYTVLKFIFVEIPILIGKNFLKGIMSIVGGSKDASEAAVKGIKDIPKKIKNKLKEFYGNLSIVKYFRNKSALNGPTLLIDFEGKEAARNTKMITYSYLAKDEDGNAIKGTFDAFSKVDVHSYLLSEGYDVYQIKESKWAKFMGSMSSTKNYKMSKKDLPFLLTQLSTYIKAGIPLVEALKIIVRQTRDERNKKVFKTLIYELTMGESLSESMSKQGEVFPRLLVNMIKTAEMTGDLAGTLDNMAEYYDAIEKTRKQMISALAYPILVLIFAVGVTIFLLIFIVPSFVEMFSDMGAELPGITLFIIGASEFLTNNAIILVVSTIVFFVVYTVLFKKVKLFKMMNQWVFMHIPIIGKVIIYNEVTMFTKTFSSLLNHNVLITESMEILNKITGNEIYKMLIYSTIANLARGDKISDAFKDQWAFPTVAYEMLVTGEKTGELGNMMEKVANFYQEQHRLSVTQIKSFIEPVIIVFLAGIVGLVVMSVVIPMFQMYDSF